MPSLNASASDWLLERVREVQASPDVTAARKIAVLLAAAGYGKTHLFGRVADALGGDVLFAFVGPIFEAQLARPLQHIVWNVVEALFDAPAGGGPPWIEQLLARLCRPSFEAYFKQLPDLLRTRHQTLWQRLQTDHLAALEIIRSVAEPSAYRRLAESIARAFPGLRNEIVRALALAWSPDGADVRRWLRGDDLPEQECARLGLSQTPPEPERVIEAIATMLQRIGVPLVICCDQLEAVLKDPEVGPINLSNGLVALLHSVPNTLIVLGCLEDAWSVVIANKVHESFFDRVHKPQKLATLSAGHAVDLVRRRVMAWDGNLAKGGTWPIAVESIQAYANARPRAPRALLQECRNAIDEWLSTGKEPVTLGNTPPPPFPEVFIQHWNTELAAMQKKAKSPVDIQEAQLFQSVKYAIEIARVANHLPPGMRVIDAIDGAIKPSGNDPRPSVGVRLEAGGKTFKVIVAVTKRDAGTAFGSYMTALTDAIKPKAVVGAVVVRPYAELNVGPHTAARKTYDKAIADGKLRPFALGSERFTFDQLECLFSILTDADDGLPLGGRNLNRDDCVKLIAENGLIKGLKLLDHIFANWVELSAVQPSSDTPAIAVAVPAAPAVAGTPPAATPPPLPVAAGPARSVATVSGPPAAAAAELKPADIKPVDIASLVDQPQAWANRMLADITAKLLLYKLPVEPIRAQVGPTFARLMVRPADTTDINKVRNKATQLRVSLGLAAAPLIDFQPGFISIDIQLPRRQIVALAPLLGTRPANLVGQTAFPAGQDVAGQTHWLNLADPSSCHLLIAGTTGSGKSEFLKVMLGAMAHGMTPEQLQFILVDPKRVTFNLTGLSPYLLKPIAYDDEAVIPLLTECADEMERRYEKLASMHKSHVSELTGADSVPRIVLMFDEFADLMHDPIAKAEMEPLLKRLGAKARASGIHLVLGTQRTEASVVTPLLRSNLPGRVSLRVASEKDSMLILDAPGAAELLGKGDLLWKQGGDLLRLQSPFVSNVELEELLRVR
ncbi:FtsK/SpoIIIE domain-containing protein [Humisphaera borealis]|uniref:DNA translocase FtsK n=1 Tax=Humisphaera borealis TaxID=2807512 RepID=A0A7M2X4P4_9BACT|nr:FtsK/SpoIIIE domain-containing protein [Humisphaera borealis]QOV92021.1 DNA translocase FtsK [Humisphaera borealis]